MNLTLTVDGTPLTFVGVPDTFVGGAPASGDPALVAQCEDIAMANARADKVCVDDDEVDFRAQFGASQTVAVGSNTFTVSIEPLSFANRRAPVEITARINLSP